MFSNSRNVSRRPGYLPGIWQVSRQAGKFLENLDILRKIWQVSRQPGKFPDILDILQNRHVSRKPRQFLESLKLFRFPGFQTAWKISRHPGNPPENPSGFKTVLKVSRQPGYPPENPAGFKTVWKVSRQLGYLLENLAGFQIEIRIVQNFPDIL